MASRYLHPLVCTKCGAALPAEEGQQILVCPYCGQSHAFVPPPLEPGASAGAPPGMPPTLKLTLIAFAVISFASIAFFALLSGGGSAPTTSGATRTTTTHGPGDPKAVYSKGQSVDIHWGSSWWPGSIVDVDRATYRAHYEGYGSGSDEWLTADRLRPRVIEDAATKDPPAAPEPPPAAPAEPDAGDPNATYKVRDSVDIRWGSSWWPGSIKKKDGNRYRIGYDGWSEASDEWVTAKRLRPRAK